MVMHVGSIWVKESCARSRVLGNNTVVHVCMANVLMLLVMFKNTF